MAVESVNTIKEWSPSDDGVRQATFALGRPLREARKRSGLSQAQVAERAGIERKFLSRLELGEAALDFKTVAALATVYGVKGSTLLPRSQSLTAPHGPEERLAWVRARNQAIAAGVNEPTPK